MTLGIKDEMNEEEFVKVLEKYPQSRNEVFHAENEVLLEAFDFYVRGCD